MKLASCADVAGLNLKDLKLLVHVFVFVMFYCAPISFASDEDSAGVVTADVLENEKTVQTGLLPEESHPMVIIRTSLGDIKLQLYPDKAPITVSNFLKYARDGFYNGTIFHRVIDEFMIQGGGFTSDMQQKPTRAPIRNEADNGLKNERGTIAMARTPQIHSATSQFFINVVDNDFLNHTAPTPQGYGYCVFGRVVEGMDVVDRIKAVPTTSMGPFQNVPVEPVEITSVEVSN